MLPGLGWLSPLASPTISEPTPISLPSRLIRAAPLQAGCGGLVKIAPAAGGNAVLAALDPAVGTRFVANANAREEAWTSTSS